MRYRENGDLERMQRFWFTGACEPRKRRRTSSKPLALAQFMSAFLLLGIGITFSGVLLLCERAYFGYIRRYMSGVENPPWCTLISLSIAESLSANKGRGKQDNEDIRIGGDDLSNEKQNDKMNEDKYDDQCSRNVDKTRIRNLSKIFAPLQNKKTTSLSNHDHHDSNGNNCPDPLCEMSIKTVTRQLDFCNKQIEMLQEALLMKDKSKANNRFLPKSRILLQKHCGDVGGKTSPNVSEWHKSECDGINIKGEGGRKSISTINCGENMPSSLAMMFDHKDPNFGQSVTGIQMLREHVHGVSISEIETVL